MIGLPGDHVACCNSAGQVTVNGVPLSESSYLYPGNQPSAHDVHIVGPGGAACGSWATTATISDDSRGHMGDPGDGTIPESGVLGRAFVIIWPPSHWGFLNIPATFEQPQLNASTARGRQRGSRRLKRSAGGGHGQRHPRHADGLAAPAGPRLRWRGPPHLVPASAEEAPPSGPPGEAIGNDRAAASGRSG